MTLYQAVDTVYRKLEPSQQWWPSLAVLYYNTILKGQYWYCIGVLAKMCNTGDYAILSNTEIFVCNTEANMMQYQENSMQ